MLNMMTVKAAYPIPRIDECIDSLRDARVFSTLDDNAGYWQIPVSEENKHLTAPTWHSGAWQCVRLPFEFCNAPANVHMAMDDCVPPPGGTGHRAFVPSWYSRNAPLTLDGGVRYRRGGHQYGRGWVVPSALGRLFGPAPRGGFDCGASTFAICSPAPIWGGL